MGMGMGATQDALVDQLPREVQLTGPRRPRPRGMLVLRRRKKQGCCLMVVVVVGVVAVEPAREMETAVSSPLLPGRQQVLSRAVTTSRQLEEGAAV